MSEQETHGKSIAARPPSSRARNGSLGHAAARFPSGDELSVAAVVLRAQAEIGNRAVAAMLAPPIAIQRGELDGAAPQPPTIDASIESEMEADASSIRVLLGQSWVAAPDEAEALSRVRKWCTRDDDYRVSTGYVGSAYLDRFLLVLKHKAFPVNTIRTGWIDEWTSAYDLLFHELEDDRAAELRGLMARSKRGSTEADKPRAESVWSFVGKREAMGGLGMMKGLSSTIAGMVDVGVWAAGGDLSKGGVADEVGKGWDSIGGEAAHLMGLDPAEKTVGDFSAFDVGTIGGKVIGGLSSAGALAEAGLAGQAIAAVQTAKSLDDLVVAVKKLRDGPPPQSWAQIAARPDVWARVVGVVAGAVGVRGGLSAAGSATQVACGNLGMALSAGQVALLVGAYRAVDDDQTVPAGQKVQRKADLLAEALTSGLTSVDARYGHEFKSRWAANVDAADVASPMTTTPEPVTDGPSAAEGPGVTDGVDSASAPIASPTKKPGTLGGADAPAGAKGLTEETRVSAAGGAESSQSSTRENRRRLDALEDRINSADQKPDGLVRLDDRIQDVDPASPDAAERIRALERDVDDTLALLQDEELPGGTTFDPNEASASPVPQEAWEVLDHIDDHGAPPEHVTAGGEFANRAGTTNKKGEIIDGDPLPRFDDHGQAIRYHEYDVDPAYADIYPKAPKESGQVAKTVHRGAWRIVRGSDGSAWFTDTHYQTWYQMR